MAEFTTEKCKQIALTKYRLKEQGQNFIPADITFRRYAKWFNTTN